MKNYLYILLIVLGISCASEETILVADDNSSESSNLISNEGHTGSFINTEKLNQILEVEYAPREFVNWVKSSESHLTKEQKHGKMKFSLSHLPIEYMALNKLKDNQVNKEDLDNAKDGFNNHEYYLLKIEVDGYREELAKYNLTSYTEYTERIKYFSFNMGKDLKMKDQNGLEIPCEILHFERAYNITPYSSFLIGFPKSDGITERTIEYNEHIFNTGPVKFKWTTDELSFLPKIKLV